MSAGDWIVLLVLACILLLIFWPRKSKKKSCSGDCAHCGQVDWEKIRDRKSVV